MPARDTQRPRPEATRTAEAAKRRKEWTSARFAEGEENFVGDSEIIALGGASNETKDRPLG